MHTCTYIYAQAIHTRWVGWLSEYLVLASEEFREAGESLLNGYLLGLYSACTYTHVPLCMPVRECLFYALISLHCIQRMPKYMHVLVCFYYPHYILWPA